MLSRSLGFLFVVALLATGCGGSDGRLPVVPIKGQLFYKQTTPATSALLVFHPKNKEMSLPSKPTAKVLEDGSFQVNTYTAQDGLPEGEYDVTVIWPRMENRMGREHEGPDQLQGRYAVPETTPLHVRIEKGKLDYRLEVE